MQRGSHALVQPDLLRVLRGLPWDSETDPRELFDAAERHGVAGVVRDRLRAAGDVLPADLAQTVDLRETARAADHEAHLAMLAAIDVALADHGLYAIALKGPLFAERYYGRPSSRATSDIDVLVTGTELEQACTALRQVGYVGDVGPTEDRYRREHHHLHLRHSSAPLLELHFHGYTGFGQILPSAPLLERRRASPLPGARAIGVLAAEDELVFLAVHAASHRFVRLGWLYDISLLVGTMSAAELEVAAARAEAWGYGRVTSFALSLLVELFGVPRTILASFADIGPIRRGLARALVGEPATPILRSASRLAYTAALCDDAEAAARYAWRTSRGHARRLLGRAA